MQRLCNRKVLFNITQQMKNFLITHKNTYKFPCINNYSFVLESVGKRIKFSTVTQMSMNSFKRNNFRHFSSSVCCKANCNNGQTRPSGDINFILEFYIKEESGKFIDGMSLLDTLCNLLKDHYNTKFKCIFFLCNKPSAPIYMYDIFHQEDFNFTCNVVGLTELVLSIVDTIEKKT